MRRGGRIRLVLALAVAASLAAFAARPDPAVSRRERGGDAQESARSGASAPRPGGAGSGDAPDGDRDAGDATPPPPSATLRYFVHREEDGAPIEGAECFARAARVFTDADGMAEIPIAGDAFGDLDYLVRAPERAIATGSIYFSRWNCEVEVELRREVWIEGVVRAAADGAPVAGAFVSGPARDFFPPGREAPEFARARTDREGRFRLGGFPSGDEYHALLAWAPGYAPEPGSYEGDRVEIRLRRFGALQGRTLDLEGRPVASALVRLIPADRPGLLDAPGPRLAAEALDATSDDRGRYAFSELPPGEAHYAFAFHDAYGDSAEPQVVRIREGPAFADLFLPPLRGVLLTVVLPGGGRPELPRIEVDRTPLRGAPVETPDGRFRIPAAAGTRRIDFRCERRPSASTTCVVGASGLTEATIRLPEGAWVSGVVVDRGGAAVPGATVAGRPLDGMRGEGEEARSDEEGRFHLGPLRPGRVALVARSPRHLPSLVIECDAPGGEVRFVLDRRGAVRFRLPWRVGGVTRILLVRPDGLPVRSPFAARATEETQEFLLDVPGRYLLVADSGFDCTVPVEFEIERSGVADLGDLVAGGGRRLLVEVRDEEGRPVADSRIVPFDRTFASEPRAGEPGSHEFARLPALPLRLSVAAPGFRSRILEVDARSERVDCRLTRR